MRWMLLGLLLAGCAPTPVDFWLGEWDATLVEDLVACGGGEMDRRTGESVWRFEANAAGPYLAAMCRLPVRVTSATYLEFVPSTCETASSTGSPVTIRVRGGSLTRDGDRFEGELVSTYQTSDPEFPCIDGAAAVVAYRRF